MKVFAVASAVAAVAAAEADPQTLLYNTAPLVHAPVVHASPLLKTIVPAATKTVTYTKPVAAAAYHVPFATQYVAHQPTVVYSKPEEVKKVEEADEEKKVVAYANTAPIAYGQPLAYPTIYNTHHQYVQAQPLHYAAAVPAQKVYHAKSAEGVEHTVINKREAEAEAKPFDYVSVQTGPLSSVKYPTIQKTLSAYNKYPVAYAAQPALVNTPYVNTPYVNTPYVAQQYATPYGYPTYF